MRLSRTSRVLLAAVLATSAAAGAPRLRAHTLAGPRFEITFASSARTEPVTGMVYLAISRDNQRSPIEQTGPTGVPLFSTYVEQLSPGVAAVISTAERGHPVASLSDIPAGDYWVQPFVNVYTRFPRADGHTVWMHMDQWEGQNWKRSPGNLYGEPTKITIDPNRPRRSSWSQTR